jgi:hypothetical protein
VLTVDLCQSHTNVPQGPPRYAFSRATAACRSDACSARTCGTVMSAVCTDVAPSVARTLSRTVTKGAPSDTVVEDAAPTPSDHSSPTSCPAVAAPAAGAAPEFAAAVPCCVGEQKRGGRATCAVRAPSD